jgi:hypothetical protein
MARPNRCRRRALVIPRYSKENSLRKLLKTFGRDPTIGSKVMDLFSRYGGRVGGTPQRTSSACSSDSMLLQGKKPTETPLKHWARSNGRIKSYGPFQPVLWTRRWYDLNGHRRRGVGIPRYYSKENCNNPAFQAQNSSDFFLYIYLTHMVPVISEPYPSHYQNSIHTINISFKSESYINT